MYSVINQCCPNHCLAICSSTVVTLTQVVPLVLFIVQFSFTCLGYTQCQLLALSFTHITCSLLICSVHFKRYNIFVSFQSFFHLGFTSRPVIKKQTILLDTDTVRAALHFCLFCQHEHLFLFLSPQGGFPVLCFFLEFPCSCLGCPFICSFTKHVSL